jgi:D-alanine-D-alanine ligase
VFLLVIPAEVGCLRNIWVLSGGPSTEFEVSLSSARVVCERMGAGVRRVTPVVVRRDGRWEVSPREIVAGESRDWVSGFFELAGGGCGSRAIDSGQALSRMLHEGVDCAFLAFHGQFGEDGRVQGFLQSAGIPFTGSGVLASALAFNKQLTLMCYRDAGLAVARSVVMRAPRADDPRLAQVRYPVFVKPVQGGSSVGIRLVRGPGGVQAALECALATDAEALVEEAVEGVEVSCGVLDLIRGDEVVSTAMPPTEIRPVGTDYFDYDAKYVPGRSQEITPAGLPEPVLDGIRRAALLAHRVLGCEGMSRTDMIVPREPGVAPVLLETNTIPGMTPTSLLPQQAAAVGIDFAGFVDALIAHALHRATR